MNEVVVRFIIVGNGLAPLSQNEWMLELRVILNLMLEDKHEPCVEWFIYTLKDRYIL